MLLKFFSFEYREYVKFVIFKNLRFMEKQQFFIAVVHFEFIF